MSVITECDRCHRQSRDPVSEGWVWHLVTKELRYPVDTQDLARCDELCHSCREQYEDWFKLDPNRPSPWIKEVHS